MHIEQENIDHLHHDDLVQEAAEWLVQLSSDDISVRLEAELEFNKWKSKSHVHLKIGTEIEQCLDSIQKLNITPQHKKITKSAFDIGLNSGKKYKNLLSTTCLAALFCIFGYQIMLFTDTPFNYLTADLRSQSNEWVTKNLEDGTQIILRGKSAVNISYDNERRVVQLVHGQIFVNVAKDKSRPFYVETSHGNIKALGTAFSVSYVPSTTQLKMLHSKVNVQPTQKSVSVDSNKINSINVSAGQGLEINDEGLQTVHSINMSNEMQKWKKHDLIVEDQSLNQVLRELDQNFKGKIVFNEHELKHLKVSAVLPLDHTKSTLHLLNGVFPNLVIKEFTPYLIVISLKK